MDEMNLQNQSPVENSGAPAPAPTPQPQQPYDAQQPPATPQPQAYAAPQQNYYAPQVAPVATELSGGMKFGWLVIGAFMGISGILLAWLTNAGNPQKMKSDAIKFAIIGLVINIVLIFLGSMILGTAVASIIYSAMPSSYYY